MTTNTIDLKQHLPDFKLPEMRFSVSGRKVSPNLDMSHYLKLNYPYLELASIDSVFGAALFPSLLYGGRPYDIKHALTWIHFQQLKQLGIHFSVTLTNHFVDDAVYEQSLGFLDKHHRQGNSIVCHSNNLARRIKADFPHYTLRASIMRSINTLEKVERNLELYDQLVIPMEMNDDDEFLQKIPCKERIMLFANAACGYSCPQRTCWVGVSQMNQGREETSDCSQNALHLKNVGKTFFDVKKFHEMGFRNFKLIPSTIPKNVDQVAAILARSNTSFATVNQYLEKPLYYLCSYQKSGRTWVRFFLANYLNLQFDLRLKLDFKTFFLLCPHDNLDVEKGVGVYDYYDDQRFPLVVSSHNSYNENYLSEQKVIFLLRSVFDTLVSNFFQHTKVFTEDRAWKGDIKGFVRSREFGIHAVCAYLNSWAARLLNQENTLVLTYESLHADHAATLEALLNYLKIPVDRDSLQKAIELSSFEAMKKVEKESSIPGINFNFSPDDADSARVRKGKVGGYTDYLDEADVDYIKAACDKELSAESKKILAHYLPDIAK
jgi:alcohol sulfotransferase